MEEFGTATFLVKKTGIGWYDEIVANDETIQEASKRIDLAALDKRLDELEILHLKTSI